MLLFQRVCYTIEKSANVKEKCTQSIYKGEGSMGVMKIGDLEENQKLHIEVIAKGGRLEYEVETLFSEGGATFIEPIRYKNQIVDFMRADMIINVIYPRDREKPIEWRGCLIKVVEYKGKYYHAVVCKNVGVEINRRGCLRIFVGESGSAMIGESRRNLKVTVKDVSASGFSFLCEQGVDAKTGEAVSLSFEDHIRHNRFNVEGKIVRKVEADEGRILYGCRMDAEHKAIEEYIAQRQREQAQHVQKQLIERAKESFYK